MNRNEKNLLDDTGTEIVNALRRIRAKRTGTEPEEIRINYRDNNFNILDRTGKLIVAALEEIADSEGGGVLPPDVSILTEEDVQAMLEEETDGEGAG